MSSHCPLRAHATPLIVHESVATNSSSRRAPHAAHCSAVVAREPARAVDELQHRARAAVRAHAARVRARVEARDKRKGGRRRRRRRGRARRRRRHRRVRLARVGVRERAERLERAQPGERLAVGLVRCVPARRRLVLHAALVHVGVEGRAQATVLAPAVVCVRAAVVADDVAVGQLRARAALRVLAAVVAKVRKDRADAAVAALAAVVVPRVGARVRRAVELPAVGRQWRRRRRGRDGRRRRVGWRRRSRDARHLEGDEVVAQLARAVARARDAARLGAGALVLGRVRLKVGGHPGVGGHVLEEGGGLARVARRADDGRVDPVGLVLGHGRRRRAGQRGAAQTERVRGRRAAVRVVLAKRGQLLVRQKGVERGRAVGRAKRAPDEARAQVVAVALARDHADLDVLRQAARAAHVDAREAARLVRDGRAVGIAVELGRRLAQHAVAVPDGRRRVRRRRRPRLGRGRRRRARVAQPARALVVPLQHGVRLDRALAHQKIDARRVRTVGIAAVVVAVAVLVRVALAAVPAHGLAQRHEGGHGARARGRAQLLGERVAQLGDVAIDQAGKADGLRARRDLLAHVPRERRLHVHGRRRRGRRRVEAGAARRGRRVGHRRLADDAVGQPRLARAQLGEHVPVRVGRHGGHEHAPLVARRHDERQAVVARPRHLAARGRRGRPEGRDAVLPAVANHGEGLERRLGPRDSGPAAPLPARLLGGRVVEHAQVGAPARQLHAQRVVVGRRVRAALHARGRHR